MTQVILQLWKMFFSIVCLTTAPVQFVLVSYRISIIFMLDLFYSILYVYQLFFMFSLSISFPLFLCILGELLNLVFHITESIFSSFYFFPAHNLIWILHIQLLFYGFVFGYLFQSLTYSLFYPIPFNLWLPISHPPFILVYLVTHFPCLTQRLQFCFVFQSAKIKKMLLKFVTGVIFTIKGMLLSCNKCYFFFSGCRILPQIPKFPDTSCKSAVRLRAC